MTRIAVGRADISAVDVLDEATPELADGQVRLAVDVFGMSANNISYAMTGDFLGYWAHFPVDDTRGCVPVWGFAEVAESRHADISVGERVFGYLSMGTELVVQPDAVTDLAFSDSIEHRAALHPWYRRLYRCAADPAHDADAEGLQATVWALFMTGWAIADDLAPTARTIVASSASSKTSLSLAWAMRRLGVDVQVVGLTSAANLDFVEGCDVYDSVRTYDALDVADLEGPVAYVDFAGNAGLKEQVHAALGDRLADSLIVGGTHQGGDPGTGELVGPAPRFFFIPDVAEAAEGGHAAFHARFADALAPFSAWIAGLLELDEASGVDAVVAAYNELLGGNPGPTRSKVLSW
ncbi:MAG: DUF2855 family protein [Actinomycetota bacterium]